ncbi:hypothetical protein BHE74_00041967 [Ensete ventricosum]|nr:hypothetical protein BHE74_00041967 [Ensete ventricosum]
MRIFCPLHRDLEEALRVGDRRRRLWRHENRPERGNGARAGLRDGPRRPADSVSAGSSPSDSASERADGSREEKMESNEGSKRKRFYLKFGIGSFVPPLQRLEARLAAWRDLLAYCRRPHTGHVLDCRHVRRRQ